MSENIYTENVKRVKGMATARYGCEVTERPKSPYGDNVWRFKQMNEPNHSRRDDPLFWRLDTWVEGVSAYCVFELDNITEEIIETRFTAMEVARESYIESQPVTN